MNTYPRGLYFKGDKCVGSAPMANTEGARLIVMHLPSGHYDFLGPISVVGKTEEQIKDDVASYVASQPLV
jgi:hypothetical protein